MSDATLTEPQPADHLTVPPPQVQLKHFEFERSEPQWMHYGDLIRILGTIAVVMGHVCDMMLYKGHDPGSLDGPGTFNWHILNGWDSLVRWAVPIYIMLSGSLLLDPNRVESPSKFYHKRLMRIGVPLVFWSLFFMWVDVYYTGWRAIHDPAFEVQKKSVEWTFQSKRHWDDYWVLLPWNTHTVWEWFKYLIFIKPQNAWVNLLKGEPYIHMHFIFRIAGLYAFTPVLRVCLKHVSRPMLIATVVTMLCLASADCVANNVTGTELSAFARFTPFLGYYLAGYLLRNAVVRGWKLLGCWAAFFVCVAILAGGTELLVKHYLIDPAVAVGSQKIEGVNGPPSMTMMLYDFLSPVRVVMAILAWIVLVNLFRNPLPIGKWGRGVIRFWANTTLGLYLIHPFFRELWYLKAPMWVHPYAERLLAVHGSPMLHKVQTVTQQWVLNGLDSTWPTVWRGVPLDAAMVYVPSLIATIIVMRIPYVRRVAG
jgi:surface polysaccharide O-acyltransferase-like enzyme